MTTRRGFLTGILALGAAPAIVRAESLMRLWVPPQELVIGHIEDFRFIESSVLPDALTYYAILHPSMEQMVNEMMRTGTGFGRMQMLYPGKLGALRHG